MFWIVLSVIKQCFLYLYHSSAAHMVSQVVDGWSSVRGISTVEQCRLGKQHAVSLVLLTAAQLSSGVVRGGLVEQCRWTIQLVKQHDL